MKNKDFRKDVLEKEWNVYSEQLNNKNLTNEQRKEIFNNLNQISETLNAIDSTKEEKSKDNLEIISRIGLSIFETGVGLIFANMWLKRSIKFEETGSYTSQTFKDFAKSIRLKAFR